MNASFENMLDLFAYFSNELTCAQYLENQRWKGEPLCPHIHVDQHNRTILCMTNGDKYPIAENLEALQKTLQ